MVLGPESKSKIFNFFWNNLLASLLLPGGEKFEVYGYLLKKYHSKKTSTKSRKIFLRQKIFFLVFVLLESLQLTLVCLLLPLIRAGYKSVWFEWNHKSFEHDNMEQNQCALKYYRPKSNQIKTISKCIYNSQRKECLVLELDN